MQRITLDRFNFRSFRIFVIISSRDDTGWQDIRALLLLLEHQKNIEAAECVEGCTLKLFDLKVPIPNFCGYEQSEI